MNDNPPAISINTLSSSNARLATVSEDEIVGTFVAQVVVSDPDAGKNGETNCSLSDEHFQMVKMLGGFLGGRIGEHMRR